MIGDQNRGEPTSGDDAFKLNPVTGFGLERSGSPGHGPGNAAGLVLQKLGVGKRIGISHDTANMERRTGYGLLP